MSQPILQITKIQQMNCQICDCPSKGHRYCTPCFQSFIKKAPFAGPGPVRGGGELADNISRQLGQTAEDQFYNYYKSAGKRIRTATKFENHKKHYDFVTFEERLRKYIRVEVKSMKARKRGQEPDPTIAYLEVHNIDGYPGWVYGQADAIAFQTPTGFLIVNRKRLVEIVNDYYKKLPYVTESGIEYTLYGRFNRKDLVMILPFSEIEKIPGNIKI